MANASLSKVVAELRSMDDAKVSGILLKELAKAARPFAPAVRAAIINIPAGGGEPYHEPPGLRLRIARCVNPWANIRGGVASVGVEMECRRMPSGQYSLPLGMDGVKRWRHPLFGNREHWYTQYPHPYFREATAGMGPASRVAVQRALDEITRQLEG